MPKLVRRVRKRSTFRNKGSQHIVSVMNRAAKNNRLSGKAAK